MTTTPAPDRAVERHRRLTHRTLPLGAVALAALAAGLIAGATTDSRSERTAGSFARALERGDDRALYDLLSEASRGRHSAAAVRSALAEATATATLVRLRAGKPKLNGDTATIPTAAQTRVFGTVRGELEVPISDEGVEWRPRLAFPGLRDGERLSRTTRAPRRAPIVSRDGEVLVSGPADARTSPLGGSGDSIAGAMAGPSGSAARRRLRERGFPRGTPVGSTGLERVFELDVAGRPGGDLIAGDRVLGRSRPRRAKAVRTTIDTRVQAAAVLALGGRLGGIAALDPRTAQVRALAGIAFSAPQPPGSTFKIVTTTAALEDRKVGLRSRFPVETKAVIDGVDLDNANGESCGGTFRQSFAHSCNSVFAPLGVKVGARRLVEVAERYGFNGAPSIDGEKPSTLPRAGEIKSPLELGSSAIGQGRVLATPLRLASMAQTVSSGGVLVDPTLRLGGHGARRRVTTRRVAAQLRRLMRDVVAYGTGTAAAIEGVPVAGKTGTAELGDTRGPDAEAGSDPNNTDAWFTSFAPARRPRIVVAALFVRAGAGGQTAAPAARAVLIAGLKAKD